MISLRFLAISGCFFLAACASAPNDVSTGQISTAETLRPPGPVNFPSAAPGGVPTAAGAMGEVTFLDPNDLAARAEGAIAAAEGGGNSGGGVFDNIQPQQASDILPPPLIPRVAAFALRTTHSVGQQQYRRNPFRRDGQGICGQFPTRDQAQDRFLRDGGPERDPNGMDPDGDGFVCGFDPTDLRASANAAAEAVDTLPSLSE